MILRGIHIEHWRCIERLDVDGLPAGIVVLHGPNRTGKSSIVKALRGCLFDFDHDSTKAEIKNSLPWNGSGPPRLCVEFETAGTLYRISKTLARRHGGARLEVNQNGNWQVLEDSPKEASRRTRELLGAERSTAGLGQLLWLDQGQTTLPASAIDATLEERLVNVLGVMVTGRDLAFKQALDDNYERWFAVSGKHKPTSPYTKLGKARSEREQALAEIEQQYQAVDDHLAALAEQERRQNRLQEEVARQQASCTELQGERERVRERLQLFGAAQDECQRLAQALAAVEKRQQYQQQAYARWKGAEQQAVRLGAAEQAADEERERLAFAHAEAEQALASARQAEDGQRARLQLIDQARQLLTIDQKRGRLQKDLARAEELRGDCRTLEEQIRGLPAVDKGTLDALASNRRQADKLRVQLQAASLALHVKLTRAGQFQLTVDDEPARDIELPADTDWQATLRQQARIDIPGWGTLELGRGQRELDLDHAAQQLAGLDQQFAAQLRVCGGDPADEHSLDRLGQQRREREDCVQRLDLLRVELRRLVPGGEAAQRTELTALDQERCALLEQHPHLAGQPSDEAELGRQARLEHDQAASLKAQRQHCERAVQDLARQQQQWADKLAGIRADLASACATAKATLAELERLGSELALAEEVQQAQAAAQAAQHRLAELQLTEAERTIDARLGDAEALLRQQQDALRQAGNEIQRLRGVLQSSEGLHARRAEAAAALLEIEEALEREQAEAEAHRHLRELFEQNRDKSVQAVMEPIAARVLGWARQIGLDDYHGLSFGSAYVPAGVLCQERSETPVALADESFGTEEQLNLLVRLALGGLLAGSEPACAVLDDPLAHTDPGKQARLLEVLQQAAAGQVSGQPTAGPLQIIIFTCHPERFADLPGARQIDLTRALKRS